MSMQWPKLLCADRLGSSRPAGAEPQRSPFQRDSDRIIFSSAFRRLQDKTQVFPLADNDYVRTRLTHSLEVASVARSLGTIVGAAICERGELPGLHASDFGAIVSAAALAHDLGNPPFGHSGEDAIRVWFENSKVAQDARTPLKKERAGGPGPLRGQCPGLPAHHAPANAGQSRPAPDLRDARRVHEISHRVAGAGQGAHPRRREHEEIRLLPKRARIFHRGRQRAAACCAARRCTPGGRGIRWPSSSRRRTTFATGWSISRTASASAFSTMRKCATASWRDRRATRCARRAEQMREEKERIEFLRALAIGAAVQQTAELFLEKEAEILRRRVRRAADRSHPRRGRNWRRSSSARWRRSTATTRGVEIEAAGFAVLGGLLDDFVAAVSDVARRGKHASPRSRKLLRLVPEQSIGPGASRTPTRTSGSCA